MDTTANASKPSEPKTTRAVLDEIVQELTGSADHFTEKEFRIAIKDSLRQRDLDADRENVDAVLQRVEENLDPSVDSHYKRGDVWADDPEVNWIWDGWIAEGYFHTLIAMQKVGKSTFLLNLIAELIQRTQSFLNFPLLSEKKYGFVLVGPDMNRRLWGKYGKLAGLLQEDDKGQAKWQEQIWHVFAEEDEIGIDRDGIKRLVTIADEIKADGAHPIFVMDSYRALLAGSGIEIEENSSRYANPLRQLKKALGKTGATVILLHHSGITSSKRSAAESNAGNAAFNSVPDQILSLKWLADAGADGNRKDRRIVLSASGRTGRVMPDQLLEQSPDWGWFTHGETGDALLKQNALNERDRLAADDAVCYDLLNTRTGNGQGTTTSDLQDLRETTSQGRGSWSLAKVNRLLRKLERKGLAFIDGSKPRPGDMGGTPAKVWWSFEREEAPKFANEAARFANPAPRFAHSHVSETAPNAKSGDEADVWPEPNPVEPVKKWTSPAYGERWIPCHPVDSQVTYEGKVWTVSQINLATGEHVITRPPSLSKASLRMIDLQPFIDEDEEL